MSFSIPRRECTTGTCPFVQPTVTCTTGTCPRTQPPVQYVGARGFSFSSLFGGGGSNLAQVASTAVPIIQAATQIAPIITSVIGHQATPMQAATQLAPIITSTVAQVSNPEQDDYIEDFTADLFKFGADYVNDTYRFNHFGQPDSRGGQFDYFGNPLNHVEMRDIDRNYWGDDDSSYDTTDDDSYY